MTPLLQVDHLSKHFGGGSGLFSNRPALRAVDDVSFSIEPGETLGLVGESGCGKTTLTRTILRLVEPTAGRVVFDGEDFGALDRPQLKAARRKVQVVFQDPYQSLNPRLTIAEIIGEGWNIHPDVVPSADRPARVAELLESVGLDPAVAGRYPQEFSGGQRQRIGIARALALNPQLLICDEPVSALDVSVQAQVVNLLSDIQKRSGISILFVAHDLAVVRHVAHRVAVMYLGKIVEMGPADDVLSQPIHPYTQALVSAVPIQHPKERATHQRLQLIGDPPSPSSPPAGCRFQTRCWKATEHCRTKMPDLILRPGTAHPSACFLAGPI